MLWKFWKYSLASYLADIWGAVVEKAWEGSEEPGLVALLLDLHLLEEEDDVDQVVLEEAWRPPQLCNYILRTWTLSRIGPHALLE